MSENAAKAAQIAKQQTKRKEVTAESELTLKYARVCVCVRACVRNSFVFNSYLNTLKIIIAKFNNKLRKQQRQQRLRRQPRFEFY